MLSSTRLRERTLEEENRKKKKDHSIACRIMLELQEQETKRRGRKLARIYCTNTLFMNSPQSLLPILAPHNIPTPPPLSPNHFIPTSGPKSVLLSSLTTFTPSSIFPFSNSPNNLMTRA